jgi:hypothetical protein
VPPVIAVVDPPDGLAELRGVLVRDFERRHPDAG